jgi:hypothetical protein
MKEQFLLVAELGDLAAVVNSIRPSLLDQDDLQFGF